MATSRSLRQDGERGGAEMAGGLELRPLHEDRELVAGEPPDQGRRERRAGGHERLADPAERTVARLVPAAVVDGLEVVHVAQHQRQRSPRNARPGHRTLQALLEGPPVAEAGQRVLVGQPGDLGEQLGAADHGGQLAGDGLQEAHVTTAEARGAGAGARPDLSPHLAVDHDRHPDLRLLAEAREQGHGGGRRVGVVDRVEVRLGVAQQGLDHRVVAQGVGLFGGKALLPWTERSDVDEDPHPLGVALPAADGQRPGADGLAGRVGHQLDHVLQAVGARRRGRHPDQGVALGFLACARVARPRACEAVQRYIALTVHGSGPSTRSVRRGALLLRHLPDIGLQTPVLERLEPGADRQYDRRGPRSHHALRHLLRASEPASVGGRARRAQAAQGRPRPDRDRRPGGHRLRLGGRAPLPGGVLALLGARGLPGGRLPAHAEHPPGPRDRPAAARR